MTLSFTVPTVDATVSQRSQGPRRWFDRAVAAVDQALRASAVARAQGEMRAFAARCESLQPQLASELRAASARLGGS